MTQIRIRDTSSTLAIFLIVAPPVEDQLGVVLEIATDGWFNGGRTFLRGFDDLLDKMETIADENLLVRRSLLGRLMAGTSGISENG